MNKVNDWIPTGSHAWPEHGVVQSHSTVVYDPCKIKYNVCKLRLE